jgi:hypothetical protein
MKEQEGGDGELEKSVDDGYDVDDDNERNPEMYV